MPENSTVVGGKAIFVINNTLHLEFQIPAQKADQQSVFVRDLSSGMKALTHSN